MIKDIGFIGLGQMGKWMALNLLKQNYRIRVFDIDDSAMEFLGEQGAIIADSPAALSEQVAMIIFSLPNEEITQKVIFGDSGIMENAVAGLVLVDCGTSGYLWSRKTAAILAEKGIHLMDAPVTGLEQRAKEGTLTIMAGGPEALFKQVQPVLNAMGTTIVHMGAVGSGQLAKMVNNVIYNSNMAALAEILPMAVKLGLEPEKIASVINSGSGRSFASEFFIPKILDNRFSDSFPLGHAYKDMKHMDEVSAELDLPLSLFQAAMNTYRKALNMGLDGEDKSAMIKVFESEMDVLFRKK